MTNTGRNSYQEVLDRYGLTFLIILAAIFTIIVYIRNPFCFEDAYITFRYARRIAAGLGFTFNDSVRTLGTTTPFFTIILASLAKLFPPEILPEMSRIIGGLTFMASTYLIYRIFQKLTDDLNLAFIAGLVYVSYPPSVGSASTGMEVPVFIMVILLSFWVFQKGRIFSAGLLAGILITIRPDGIIWTAALGIPILFKPRKLLRYLLGFSIIAIPYIIILTIFFGNPIPLSVIAKKLSYGPYCTLDFSNLFRVLGIFLPYSLGFKTVPVVLVWTVFSIFLILALYRSYIQKDSRLLPIIGFIFLYVAFLWYGRTEMFRWYSFFLYPALLIVIVHTIYHFIFSVNRLKFTRFTSIVVVIAVSGWVFLGVWRMTIYQRESGLIGLEDLQRRGFFFRDYTPPDASIFLEPIAQIGYFSQRHIFCEIGLVSPEVVDAKKKYGDKLKESCGWYFDILREYTPDYLMLRTPYFDNNRLFPYKEIPFMAGKDDSAYFYQNYELVNLKEQMSEEEYSEILPGLFYIFKRKSEAGN